MRISVGLLVVGIGLVTLSPHRSSGAQSPAGSRQSAVADAAIYAAFLETVNRDPRADTLFVDAESAVFQSMSAHYDSVAPGLGAALVKASSPPRAASTLHLPPPIVWITATTPEVVRERAMNGPPGHPASKGQGTKGVWKFSPIVYSRNGRDALLYYRLVCGAECGEDALVWAGKAATGKWEIRRTAILGIR